MEAQGFMYRGVAVAVFDTSPSPTYYPQGVEFKSGYNSPVAAKGAIDIALHDAFWDDVYMIVKTDPQD